MTDESIKAVLITGTIGSGKTAVATEIGEVLESRRESVAIIDLDWLGWLHDPSGAGPGPDELIVRNLGVVWPNFVAAGVRYLVVTRALQNQDQIGAIRAALPGVDVKVAVLTSAPELIETRLGRRDTGTILAGHLKESVAMAPVLESLPADLRIENDERPTRAVAEELLTRLGWI